MNPFQHFKREVTTAPVALSNLLDMMIIFKADLDRYRHAESPNPYRITRDENILILLANYIDSVERENYLNVDAIKKQALIIQSAGIQYPTIFQSLEHIYEIFLQSRGDIHLLGNDHKNIQVQIPVL